MIEKEDDFFHGVRLYREALLSIFENKGEEGVKKELRKTFDDKTLALFPENLTKESLSETLMRLKHDEVGYRIKRFNEKS